MPWLRTKVLRGATSLFVTLLCFVGGTFCPVASASGCVRGSRRHDASCCNAWCQAARKPPWLLHSFPEATGRSPGGSPALSPREKPTSCPRQPAREPCPCGVPRTSGRAAPAPLQRAPAPGFQNYSTFNRQAPQPIKSRKASAQRSLSAVSQSSSLVPYIPPSEDWLCRLLP